MQCLGPFQVRRIVENEIGLDVGVLHPQAKESVPLARPIDRAVGPFCRPRADRVATGGLLLKRIGVAGEGSPPPSLFRFRVTIDELPIVGAHRFDDPTRLVFGFCRNDERDAVDVGVPAAGGPLARGLVGPPRNFTVIGKQGPDAITVEDAPLGQSRISVVRIRNALCRSQFGREDQERYED